MSYNIDHIYVLTTANMYERRMPNLLKNLKRVGLIDSEKDSILDIRFGLRPNMYRYVIDNTSRIESRRYMCPSSCVSKDLSATLSHYLIYQEAKERGFNRVMVVEDDEIFMNDTDLFRSTLESLPADSDLALLDWLPVYQSNYFRNGSHRRSLERCNGSPWVKSDDYCLCTNAGCTIRSARAVDAIIKLLESAWYPTGLQYADEFKAIDRWQDQGILRTFGHSMYLAYPHLCVQNPSRSVQYSSYIGPLYSNVYDGLSKFDFSRYS